MDENTRDSAPSVFAPSREQAQRIEELQTALGALRQEFLASDQALDEEQQLWEAELAGQPEEQRALAASYWSCVGPFLSDDRYLESRNYGPEGRDIDLAQTFNEGRPEKLSWRRRPEWSDGQRHQDIIGDGAANYLHRRINSPAQQQVAAKLSVQGGVRVYLNGKKLVDRLKEELSFDGEPVELKLDLEQGENHLLIKLLNHSEFSTTPTSGFKLDWQDGVRLDPTPLEVAEAIKAPAEQRSEDQRTMLAHFFRSTRANNPSGQELAEKIRKASLELAIAKSGVPTTLVMREREAPRPAFLLIRGQYDTPDKQLGPLERRVPSFLPPLPKDAPRDRLGYAQWMVSPENPLHARVTVNRLWQQFFGVGIVETPDDFGMQGAWPSHPELLDWLAVEFRETGWDVRHMIRLIVLSHTYRQSSTARPEAAAQDPQNRLLARGPRRRLDAEVVRDQALMVSGLLVQKLGGPSVKPPQPDGLWEAVAYVGSNTQRFEADTAHRDVHRRSLYTFWKRTSPPPQMTILDAPSRESCTVRREQTNTPLQALLLLNESQYVEAARALAERCLRESGDGSPEAVAGAMFSLATLRDPTAEELQTLCGVYQASLDRYANDPEDAERLISVGVEREAPTTEPSRLAAWTLVANTVLNLDEVLVKE